MVAEFKKKSAACPKQKYILGGHSQGGMVTVGAFKILEDATKVPKESFDRILAVTMFGSPPCPASVKTKCMSYCHKGDFVSCCMIISTTSYSNNIARCAIPRLRAPCPSFLRVWEHRRLALPQPCSSAKHPQNVPRMSKNLDSLIERALRLVPVLILLTVQMGTTSRPLLVTSRISLLPPSKAAH